MESIATNGMLMQATQSGSPPFHPTQRAADGGYAPRFLSHFAALGFFRFEGESTLPPTAANASRWALDEILSTEFLRDFFSARTNSVVRMSDYDDVKVGDEVYFITESRWMAFCRIKRIKKIICDQPYPDFTEYLLEILKLPIHDMHEYFRPYNYNKILKYFTVRHAPGMYYSGMWRFYTPREFEHYYGDYHVVMVSWARYVIPRHILFAAIITICILAVRGFNAFFR